MAVTVIVPGWPGSERTQTAPSPPYSPNANGLSPSKIPGPSRFSVTSPAWYLRWLPYKSTARNRIRVASVPSAEIVASSAVMASRSPDGSDDMRSSATCSPLTKPWMSSSGSLVRVRAGRRTKKGG